MATTYHIGDVARLSVAITRDAVAIDPDTLSLIIHPPSGTDVTLTYPATIIKSAAGNYYYDYALTLSGDHRYRWVSTGSGAGAEPGLISVNPNGF